MSVKLNVCFYFYYTGNYTFALNKMSVYRVQYATDELWIPSTSPFKSNKEWRNLHFRRNTRYENILFKGENVLSPEGLRQVGWNLKKYSD